MRSRTLVIVLVVLAVLLPMWFVAIQGEPPSEEIAIDHSVSEIRPLEGPIDTPTKLSPSQVGVIVWVALLALLGVLAFFHRFMDRLARPGGGESTAVADGGVASDAPSDPRSDGGVVTFPWIETDDRWVVTYHDASDAIEGLVAMGGLTVLTIVFAALFTGEYLTLARTQYFGIYAFGMFMSLTGLTVSYYAWFMPHVEVAERRDH
ncbi:hypothetical protein [Halosimplex halophilum]|uniref:hypothetical protein n=1 Tax=Halosimplex halophilum TaxID=2559572 RepID=UPI00107F8D4D|nr:hypothetical protein [Halosimplex halophilum]